MDWEQVSIAVSLVLSVGHIAHDALRAIPRLRVLDAESFFEALPAEDDWSCFALALTVENLSSRPVTILGGEILSPGPGGNWPRRGKSAGSDMCTELGHAYRKICCLAEESALKPLVPDSALPASLTPRVPQRIVLLFRRGCSTLTQDAHLEHLKQSESLMAEARRLPSTAVHAAPKGTRWQETRKDCYKATVRLWTSAGRRSFRLFVRASAFS